MLTDDAPPIEDDRGDFRTQGRGQKHPREEDQMSVESTGTKRQDVLTSAEKNRAKSKNKNKNK